MDAPDRILERLRNGSATYACGGYLAALDDLQRSEIYTALIFDRALTQPEIAAISNTMG